MFSFSKDGRVVFVGVANGVQCFSTQTRARLQYLKANESVMNNKVEVIGGSSGEDGASAVVVGFGVDVANQELLNVCLSDGSILVFDHSDGILLQKHRTVLDGNVRMARFSRQASGLMLAIVDVSAATTTTPPPPPPTTKTTKTTKTTTTTTTTTATASPTLPTSSSSPPTSSPSSCLSLVELNLNTAQQSAATGKGRLRSLLVLHDTNNIRKMEVADDDDRIVACITGEGNVVLYDGSRRETRRLMFLKKAMATSVAVAATTATLAIGISDGRIRVYHQCLSQNLARKSLNDCPFSTLHWHTQLVSAVSWARDSTTLYSGGQEHVMVLWQNGARSSNERTFMARLTAEIDRICVSWHGELIAMQLRDGTIVVVALAGLETRAVIVPGLKYIARITSIARMELSKHAKDRKGENSAIYDRRCKNLRPSKGRACFEPHRRLLVAVAASNTLQFYDVLRGRHVTELEVSESLAGAAGARVAAISARDGAPPGAAVIDLFAFARHRHLVTIHHREEAKTSSKSLLNEAHRRDYSLQFWHYDSKFDQYLLTTSIRDAHRGAILCVATHPLSPLVVTGGSDGKFRLWHLVELDLEVGGGGGGAAQQRRRTSTGGDRSSHKQLSWQCRAVGYDYDHDDPVNAVAFAHDGTVLAVGVANRISLWRPFNVRLIVRLSVEDNVLSLHFVLPTPTLPPLLVALTDTAVYCFNLLDCSLRTRWMLPQPKLFSPLLAVHSSRSFGLLSFLLCKDGVSESVVILLNFDSSFGGEDDTSGGAAIGSFVVWRGPANDDNSVADVTFDECEESLDTAAATSFDLLPHRGHHHRQHRHHHHHHPHPHPHGVINQDQSKSFFPDHTDVSSLPLLHVIAVTCGGMLRRYSLDVRGGVRAVVDVGESMATTATTATTTADAPSLLSNFVRAYEAIERRRSGIVDELHGKSSSLSAAAEVTSASAPLISNALLDVPSHAAPSLGEIFDVVSNVMENEASDALLTATVSTGKRRRRDDDDDDGDGGDDDKDGDNGAAPPLVLAPDNSMPTVKTAATVAAADSSFPLDHFISIFK